MLYADFKRKQMHNSIKLGEAEGYYCELDKSKGKNLKNYRIYGNYAQSTLPYPYKELEYIASTGTQWIDTGIKPTVSATVRPNIKIKYALDTLSVMCRIFGVTDSSTYFQLYFNKSPNEVGIQAFNSGVYVQLTVDTNFHEVEIDFSHDIYINDGVQEILEYGLDYGCGSTDLTLHLFGRNSEGTHLYNSNMKIALFEYNDGTQNIKLLPCCNTLTNERGMYDTVNNIFFPNKGTGEFIAGAEIETTPEASIPVYSLGERTRNKFDVNQLINAYRDNDGTLKPISSWRTTPKIAIDSDTITISGELMPAAITFWDENDIGRRAAFTEPLPYTYSTIGKIYVALDWMTPSLPQLATTQIEEGSTETDYIPYNAIEVKSSGKNLYKGGNLQFTGYSTTITDTIMPELFDCIKKLKPNTTYTLSFGYSTNGSGGAEQQIRLVNTNNGVLYKINNGVPFSTSNFDVNNIDFITAYNGVGCTNATWSNITVSKGTATEYEPYQTPLTTVIDLTGHEPLRKVGDVADYIDYENSRIVRNVGEKVFTGAEALSPFSNPPFVQSDTLMWFYSEPLLKITIGDYDTVLCNSLKSRYAVWTAAIQDEGISVLNNYICVKILKTRVNYDSNDTLSQTIEKIKRYLKSVYDAGEPIIAYYRLATPIYEPIELPRIPTTKDTCIITARDEYLDSSNIYAKYYKK